MKRKDGSMKKKLLSLLALGLAAGGPICAFAGSPEPAASFDRRNASGRQLLLRADDALAVAARHGLRVLHQTEHGDGILYLVEAPAGRGVAATLRALAADDQVTLAETVEVASLPAQAAAGSLLLEASPDVQRSGNYVTRCQAYYLRSGDVWAGYSDQRAARTIKVANAHYASYFCGAGVKVAVIDTGVDGNHPLLAGAVLPGYDLLDPTGNGSEWANLDHSVRAIVEHSVRAIVEQSSPVVMAGSGRAVAGGAMAAVLGEQSIIPFQETGLPPYFGHGTMVAGLVRLVAPGARIVPIRAFDGTGTASVYDIVRAIRWATDQGAHVINMSFSLEDSTTELRNAIRYAEARGVLMVAAVGNQGAQTRIYPATYSEVLGAAAQSTASSGGLATFSNWGTAVADLAAPGSAILTTFPGGLYAAGWGTSFSSPLVAGAAALIYERPHSQAYPGRELRYELMMSTTPRPALNNKVVSGQLDVYRAWQLAGN